MGVRRDRIGKVAGEALTDGNAFVGWGSALFTVVVVVGAIRGKWGAAWAVAAICASVAALLFIRAYRLQRKVDEMSNTLNAERTDLRVKIEAIAAEDAEAKRQSDREELAEYARRLPQQEVGDDYPDSLDALAREAAELLPVLARCRLTAPDWAQGIHNPDDPEAQLRFTAWANSTLPVLQRGYLGNLLIKRFPVPFHEGWEVLPYPDGWDTAEEMCRFVIDLNNDYRAAAGL